MEIAILVQRITYFSIVEKHAVERVPTATLHPSMSKMLMGL